MMSDILSSPRTPHLLKLWAELMQQRELPQIDRWLGPRLKADRRFGSKDRRWYAEAIYQGLRYALPTLEQSGESLAPLEFWTRLKSAEPRAYFEALLALPLDSDQKSAGFNSWLSEKYERRAQISQWSDEARTRFLRLQNERAPLWLRTQPQHRKKLEGWLASQSLAHSWDGDALRIDARVDLEGPVLSQGWAEVQDLGSQRIAQALPALKPLTVWDACAGGGGKTLQLAALYPAATVFASDVRSYKTDEVKRRADRAGLKNVRSLAWDGGSKLDRPKSAAQGFDLILVDAPCSGSGTFRRNPDARLRQSQAQLDELSALQKSIVEKAIAQLKPGGTLVYATCSFYVEENEAIADHAVLKGLTLLSQSIHGLPDDDADTLFAAVLGKPEA